MDGRLERIQVAPKGGEGIVAVGEATAVAGKGLEGDRYFLRSGTYSDRPGPGREVTLVEAEAIEGANAENGLAIVPERTRRNLVTRGVALNHLVGRDFHIGEVVLRGVRLCEPCQVMDDLNGDGARRALVHRGGLRCDIVAGGVIRVGDPVVG